jgi:hypothetical protein
LRDTILRHWHGAIAVNQTLHCSFPKAAVGHIVQHLVGLSAAVQDKDETSLAVLALLTDDA